MSKPMFDVDALIAQFESATAQQGAQLRKATTEATMAALQGRELTLKNIRGALKQVAEAASTGVAKNMTADIDPEALLDQAVAGMDAAMLKAVDAHRVALQQLAAQGADLREKHLKKAIVDLEKFEDMMVDTVQKAAGSAGDQMAGAWAPVLERLQAGGSVSGAQSAATAEQFMAQMKQMHSAVRDSRAAGLRAAQALAEGYTAMVSGVLIGMADAMRGSAGGTGGSGAAAKAARTRR
jgi:hypothetical protein